MSLINDALKKAARQRAQDQAHVIPPMPGGGGGGYGQSRPKSMQTMVLIGAGAVALIVVSVVVTGMMMNRAPEAKVAAVAPVAAATVAAAPLSSPTPAPQKVVVQAPQITISLPQAEPVVRVAPPTALPRPTPTPVPIVRAEPTPVATPPPAAATPAVPAQSQADAIQALIDGFLISGVRSAGSESKALINGHVYKLNDLIDKTLGLRLVKVEQDKLTFVTRDGATFVKTF
jgi:hypothetical protein